MTEVHITRTQTHTLKAHKAHKAHNSSSHKNAYTNGTTDSSLVKQASAWQHRTVKSKSLNLDSFGSLTSLWTAKAPVFGQRIKHPAPQVARHQYRRLRAISHTHTCRGISYVNFLLYSLSPKFWFCSCCKLIVGRA